MPAEGKSMPDSKMFLIVSDNKKIEIKQCINHSSVEDSTLCLP